MAQSIAQRMMAAEKAKAVRTCPCGTPDVDGYHVCPDLPGDLGEMAPSQKIRATAADMIRDDHHGWQSAASIIANRYGWTAPTFRIAAVQAAQLADANRSEV